MKPESARILISGCHDVPGTVWLDDVKFGIRDQNQGEFENSGEAPQSVVTLVQDGFEAYPDGELPAIGGWLTELDILPKLPGGFSNETGSTYIVDNKEHSSGSRSFKLESLWGWPVVAAKSLALPERIPYGASDGMFKIEEAGESPSAVRGEGGEKTARTDRIQDRPKLKDKKAPEDSEGGDPYYFYSFDGKLMAAYDDSGNCLSDFIYMGNRFVADYRPQESRYYYYTSDQINSFRMITDDAGTVVYSTTFDPFGGIEKAWVSTYDPALKFSNKEREPAYEMDYFKARR